MKTFVCAVIISLINCASALCQEAKTHQYYSTSRVTLRVLDKETFQPIEAKILVASQSPGSQIAPVFEDKVYKYRLPLTDTCTFSIYAPGYEMLNESLLANEINGTEVFFLTPKEVDKSPKPEVVATNAVHAHKPILHEDITSVLYFNQSNTNMSGRSQRELERVVDFLNMNENLQIELAGHTDNLGDEEKNMLLSWDRADVVKQHLLENNISPARIKSKAFGSARPVAPNDSERNRRFNRRVIIEMSPAH
ncbi:OmpA family protein [Dyadobacter sp. CY326]|uniref:OmpA family protein n=1 Tax=Dyadobacter sp. CY326 TaxID=2907300 RepID=UPI001F486ED5|nr:OmpA family protein [Dyadobacter sp. CY326]MCE7064998.1 OmpA family protein [Dyadobacter sp. CY326]